MSNHINIFIEISLKGKKLPAAKSFDFNIQQNIIKDS